MPINKSEPKTNQEFIDALRNLNAEVEEDCGKFTLYYKNGQGRDVPMTLDAEDFSNALFEAYNFLKE